MSISVTITI